MSVPAVQFTLDVMTRSGRVVAEIELGEAARGFPAGARSELKRELVLARQRRDPPPHPLEQALGATEHALTAVQWRARGYLAPLVETTDMDGVQRLVEHE